MPSDVLTSPQMDAAGLFKSRRTASLRLCFALAAAGSKRKTGKRGFTERCISNMLQIAMYYFWPREAMQLACNLRENFFSLRNKTEHVNVPHHEHIQRRFGSSCGVIDKIERIHVTSIAKVTKERSREHVPPNEAHHLHIAIYHPASRLIIRL